MRQQQEVACLQQEGLSATLLEKASSLGHNMKLCPAELLRLMLRFPPLGEPADFLDFRVYTKQWRDGRHRIRRNRTLYGAESVIDPLGTIFEPLEHSPAPLRSHLIHVKPSGTHK